MGTCSCAKEQVKPNKPRRRNLRPSILKDTLIEDSVLRESINNIFDKFDKNRDGIIEGDEIEDFVKHSFKRCESMSEDKENKSTKGAKRPGSPRASKFAPESKEKSEFFYMEAADRLTRMVGDGLQGKITKEEMFKFYKKK